MKTLGTFVAAVALIIIVAAISGWVTQFSWNHVVPDVIGLKPITWAQGIWFNILVTSLFSSTTASKSSSKS